MRSHFIHFFLIKITLTFLTVQDWPWINNSSMIFTLLINKFKWKDGFKMKRSTIVTKVITFIYSDKKFMKKKNTTLLNQIKARDFNTLSITPEFLITLLMRESTSSIRWPIKNLINSWTTWLLKFSTMEFNQDSKNSKKLQQSSVKKENYKSSEI